MELGSNQHTSPTEKIPEGSKGEAREKAAAAVGANASHGLRRTNEDKRRAVLTLLQDGEWRTYPEREIARLTNVSHTFVQRLRSEHLATLPDKPDTREVTRNGVTYQQNTTNIGRPVVPQQVEVRESCEPVAGAVSQEPDNDNTTDVLQIV